MEELQLIKEFEKDLERGDFGEIGELDEEALVSPVSYKKAIAFYRSAAENKSAHRGKALYLLAYCYKHARGANKDAVKALEMFEALAKIDCSKAELPETAKFTANANISLADCYFRGIGTVKNVEHALAIWQKFAKIAETENYEDGCEAACRCLGNLYSSCKYVPQDYEKAYDLYMLAAIFGDIPAINNLGWCYENGYGVEKDINRAVENYKDAAACGNVVARNNLKRLKKDGIITDGEND